MDGAALHPTEGFLYIRLAYKSSETERYVTNVK